MVFIMLIKKTTLVRLNMLKSICPKWQGIFFTLVQFGFFFPRIFGLKNQEF